MLSYYQYFKLLCIINFLSSNEFWIIMPRDFNGNYLDVYILQLNCYYLWLILEKKKVITSCAIMFWVTRICKLDRRNCFIVGSSILLEQKNRTSIIFYIHQFGSLQLTEVLLCVVKRNSDAIFVVCSHTFSLFWLRKTSVIFKIYQISFHMFVCVFTQEIIFL